MVVFLAVNVSQKNYVGCLLYLGPRLNDNISSLLQKGAYIDNFLCHNSLGKYKLKLAMKKTLYLLQNTIGKVTNL
jgi:hypothetical protein